MLVRFGGLAIDSEVPLPSLPPTTGSADIVVRTGDVAIDARALVQEWPDVDGRRWLSIFRDGDGYRVSVAGLECRISADGREIVAQRAPGLDDLMLAHLVSHQILPLAVSRTRRLVLHACAVQAGAGALAFVGETGVGKSTMSMAFARRGHALIADDALVVSGGEGPFMVEPTADAVRLWPNPRMRELVEGAESLPSASAKVRARVPIAADALPLARLLLLGTSEDGSVSVAPLPTAEMRVELLSHLFRLDIGDQDESRWLFDYVHGLVAQVPVRRVLYPDGAEYLDSVVDAILRDSISPA